MVERPQLLVVQAAFHQECGRARIRERGGEYCGSILALTAWHAPASSEVVPAPRIRPAHRVRSGGRSCLLALDCSANRPTSGTSFASWSPRPNRPPTNSSTRSSPSGSRRVPARFGTRPYPSRDPSRFGLRLRPIPTGPGGTSCGRSLSAPDGGADQRRPIAVADGLGTAIWARPTFR